MKIKYTILFILFTAFYFSSSSAQQCGTDEPKIKKKGTGLTIPDDYNRTGPICINIKYHIVRESNGSGGFNANQLNNVTSQLENAFEIHDIYFNNLGFDYIDNSAYVVINDASGSSTEFDALVQINNDPNAINIYIIDSAVSWEGKADGIPSQAFVIEDGWANTQVTSHEMGHCLNLWHTFQGTAINTSGCAEAINGSNCSTCGDRVCDTPADANTGTSGGFMPSFDNIMSYYYPFHEITPGQSDRIRQAITFEPVLQQVLSSSCITGIDGPDSLCSGDTAVYTFGGLPPGATITWNYTYILSGQGTPQVTIGAFTGNPSITISATVTDNGTSTTYDKVVTILPNENPATPFIVVSPYSPTNLTCCGQTYQFEHARCSYNCTNIEWDFTVYSSNPADIYGFNDTGNVALVTMNKNSYSPFILNAKAKNNPENCGNASAWSNGITKYYGTVSARVYTTEDEKSKLNKSLPLIESFNSRTNTLSIEKVDLYAYLDAIYSDRELSEDEANQAVRLLSKDGLFDRLNVEVFNFYGTKVFDRVLDTKQAEYNLSNLTSGVYFLKYNFAGEIITNKIIVK